MIEKEITHEHYKEALFQRKQFMHKMKILRSEGHEMYGMCMNKISISPLIQSAGLQKTESKRGHTGISGGRQLSIRRHNQQLFTNKAALGPVRQIIDNRLIWLGLIFNDLVDIYNQIGSNALLYFVDGLEETGFSLIVTAGFLPIRLVTSLFRALTTSGSLFTHSVDRLPSGRSIPTAY